MDEKKQEQYEKLPCVVLQASAVDETVGSSPDRLLDPVEVTVTEPCDKAEHSMKDEESHGNRFTRFVESVEESAQQSWKENQVVIWRCIYGFLSILYCVYFIYVLTRDFQRAVPLVILTATVIAYFGWSLFKHIWGESVQTLVQAVMSALNDHQTILSRLTYFFLGVLIVTFLTITGVFRSIIDEPVRLISLFGLILLLMISFIMSKHRSRINWNTVFWGIYLQVLFALFILRTELGFVIFHTIGKQVEIFLQYAMEGAKFVFGPAPLSDHQFAFLVLPVVIYACAVFALLFYVGVMQSLINGLAWVMHRTMKVSGVEAFCAAANVFLGMTVVPMSIKPYLPDMTSSELHSMMVGGFATIAGGVLAVYIKMGISAAHLISASIISAPAALVASKMFYPETARPKNAGSSKVDVSTTKEKNCLEAFFNGAVDGTRICGYIIGNLIAILSFLAFINEVLRWFGELADVENLSFQLVCHYILWPFAWMLGVEWADCGIIAELIGTKTFLNEFIAYTNLRTHMEAGRLSERSVVIATYALCGFSNLGSLGVLLGGLMPLIPQRLTELANMAPRALIAASVACQMTACLAGVLYDENLRHFTIVGNLTTIAPVMTDDVFSTFPTTGF